MNIAVCDGEENVRTFIKGMIEKQEENCRIMEFSSGSDLLQFWQQEDREQIDLLFLDEEAFAQAVREYRYLEAKKNTEPKEILFRNGNETRKVSADDIYYIESSNRKIIVYMQDEKIECYGKLGELENELKEGFFRIHRGYLINMKYVERYNRTEIQMKNGSHLLISKYKYQDFIKAYLGYHPVR